MADRPNLIQLARQCSCPEELSARARENRIFLSEEDSQIYFSRWHMQGELDDDALDDVSGGYIDLDTQDYVCEHCLGSNLMLLMTGGYYCLDCKRPCNGKRL